MWAGLIDLLFPPRCAGCGGRGGLFCEACQDALSWIRPPICLRCGDPLPDCPSGVVARCRSCLRVSPAYSIARSVASYEGPLRLALHTLKYRRRKALAGPLGRVLVAFMDAEVAADARAVVPVPLHRRRLAERGFNQSALLARPVACALGVPLVPDAVQRLRQEVPQAVLGASERLQNVRGAFGPGRASVRGTVLLVDDVFSTGATAEACARALLQAGAERVAVLTLARAILKSPPSRPDVSNGGRRLHAPVRRR